MRAVFLDASPFMMACLDEELRAREAGRLTEWLRRGAMASRAAGD